MSAHYPDLLPAERNVGLELQPSWLLDRQLWALQLQGLLSKGSARGGFCGAEPLRQVLSFARVQQLKRFRSYSETTNDYFQRVLRPQWVTYWASMGSNTI